MTDSTAIINLGEFVKPATILVEKVSDAVGGLFLPWQIRRVAEANVQADVITATGQIHITDLHRRAAARFVREEAQKQLNMESITRQALPLLSETATPSEMANDWITNFYDKCRLVSDEEMQKLWAHLLAAEANSPGEYSKRTVNLLASLDKEDAVLFTSLCSFVWLLPLANPLIYDEQAEIYKSAGLQFARLTHLDAIGLISFNASADIGIFDYPEPRIASYYGEPVHLLFADKPDFRIGKVIFTKSGRELARICSSPPAPLFKQYVIDLWREFGYIVEEPAGGALA